MTKDSMKLAASKLAKLIGYLFAVHVLALINGTNFYTSSFSLELGAYIIFIISALVLLLLFRRMSKMFKFLLIPYGIFIWYLSFAWTPFFNDNYVHPCIEMSKQNPDVDYCSV